jgi:hypothetical protein
MTGFLQCNMMGRGYRHGTLEDEENLSPELRRGCVFTLVKDNCPAGVASALAIASPEMLSLEKGEGI